MNYLAAELPKYQNKNSVFSMQALKYQPAGWQVKSFIPIRNTIGIHSTYKFQFTMI